ncbi:uncharacterized protein FIBRA_08578 [Fibroporia radiculosa]|uniref:protein-serine/threonine phosphatase n=1 Tax=Fibroporia radiculosa TaxID=599839 RepID=J4GX24_9APHY|nr:uncharacterized protein FIBRA_08578 [Fibroporia radiculosa]CCM06325.1 predicted protein [Fibroporia radiculosa]
MGQQQSKRTRKSAKDKDKDDSATHSDFAGVDDNSQQGSLPRATTAEGTNGSASSPPSEEHSASNTSSSEPAAAPKAGHSPRPVGSDTLASPASNSNSKDASLLPPAPSASPSTSPLLAAKPPPLDIPMTQTILSNASSPYPTPGSTGSVTADPMANANGARGVDKNKQLDIDDFIQRLLDVGYTGKVSKSLCLKNTEIATICLAARDVFLGQPTLIELSPPVKIVGDVHGQYSDLIRLFEMCGFPPAANYLFLVYGFYDECKRRCNIKTWKLFIDVFNCLPIAAVVASKIFCVHGGLSPSLHSMDDIKRIQRPTDVPDYGLLNDLLWSDPSDTAADWEDNERGVSYCFGKSVLNDFLMRYDMDLICRAHMVVEDGYEFWNERTLVTVFSAPNYCGEFDNYGACMSVSEELLCAFELLKPLDGPALRKEMTKAKRKTLMATTT